MSLEELQNTMDFNGYAHFSSENYKRKDDTPCFIPENAVSLDDVSSWKGLFNEGLEVIKTKEFLLAVCENYGNETAFQMITLIKEEAIDFDEAYPMVTDDSPEKFVEDFMDFYFFGGDDVWCSFSTKLADYTNY